VEEQDHLGDLLLRVLLEVRRVIGPGEAKAAASDEGGSSAFSFTQRRVEAARALIGSLLSLLRRAA
jgi:hypothetical protein